VPDSAGANTPVSQVPLAAVGALIDLHLVRPGILGLDPPRGLPRGYLTRVAGLALAVERLALLPRIAALSRVRIGAALASPSCLAASHKSLTVTVEMTKSRPSRVLRMRHIRDKPHKELP
jgi:hypothetical protein